MRNYGLLFFVLLILVAAITLACGSATPHMLQTVTVSPATADAQTLPNGQVQFTATGVFVTRPSPVTPLTVQWGTCNLNGVPSEISVNQSGVAQCAPGASGTFVVQAVGQSTPPPHVACNTVLVCGIPSGDLCGEAVGVAKLTCP
ncbi:MAG TPA: hypothetical protein VKA07_15425 [Candidatus Sulfotelmatobacter sp.]|nr:hypothetical protein [Candidatus Sulfotelmatobacter sp.]